MIAGLRGLQTLNTAVKGFAAVLPTMGSNLLQGLLTPGQGFPELDSPLGDLEGATDWQEAAASGRAVPAQVCLVPVQPWHAPIRHLKPACMGLATDATQQVLHAGTASANTCSM